MRQHVGVLIFLPPSEAKATGGQLPPLRGAVAGVRAQILTEVAGLTACDPAAAAAALKIPSGAIPEASGWNAAALDSPTMTALDRYAGVVYEALDVRHLTPSQRQKALATIRIFSGGFGYLRADEPVPVYRIPASGRLPRLGGITAAWKPVLREVVPADIGDQLVVDLRSSDYAALWTPTKELRAQILPVRVLTRIGGVEKVVSYNSKHVKGILARALIRSRARSDTAARVARLVESLGYRARLLPGPRLEVVEPAG